jgi:hypothetical protein
VPANWASDEKIYDREGFHADSGLMTADFVIDVQLPYTANAVTTGALLQ